MQAPRKPRTGWWFRTFFIFHNIWDNPSCWLLTNIFQRGWNHQPDNVWSIPIFAMYRRCCFLWVGPAHGFYGFCSRVSANQQYVVTHILHIPLKIQYEYQISQGLPLDCPRCWGGNHSFNRKFSQQKHPIFTMYILKTRQESTAWTQWCLAS